MIFSKKFRVAIYVFLFFMLISCTPQALAFNSHGDINDDISYSGVKVYKPSKYSMKVCGYLKNNTDYKAFIDVNLVFQYITGTKINWGRVVENIKPKASKFFDVYLERDDNFTDTKEAICLKWNVDDLTIYRPGDMPSSQSTTIKNKPQTNKVENRSQTITESKTIYISGSGRQTSDEFTLEPGKHMLKISYQGPNNFVVILLDQYGNQKEYLANEIGDYENRLAFFIRKKGRYLLDIDSSGTWSIEIQKPEKSTYVEQRESEPEKKPRVPMKANRYEIIFFDGKVLKAQEYWEKGNEIAIEMYGTTVFFDKAAIKEIKPMN